MYPPNEQALHISCSKAIIIYIFLIYYFYIKHRLLFLLIFLCFELHSKCMWHCIGGHTENCGGEELLLCSVKMDVKTKHREALKHNWDFTAVMKYLAVNLERMGSLISLHLERKTSPHPSRYAKRRITRWSSDEKIKVWSPKSLRKSIIQSVWTNKYIL